MLVLSLGSPLCAAQAEPSGAEGAQAVVPENRELIAWGWNNEPVRYRLVRTTEDAIPVPGKDPVTKQTLGRTVRHELVSESGEAPARIRLTWESIRYEQDDSLNEPLRYDSTKEHHWTRTRNPIIGSVASSLDTSLVLVMDPDGTLRAVGELDTYLRGIEKNLTMWGLARDDTYEQLQMVYTEDALLTSSAGTYRFLPKETMSVGDSYEVSRPFSLAHVRTLESVETHTLESVDIDDEGHRIARFTIAGTLRWPDPGGLADQVFNVSLDKETLEGSWSFDIDRGRVLDYRLEASFLADIVRYDPRDRSSTEMSTRQTVLDTMELLNAEEESAVPAGAVVPSDP